MLRLCFAVALLVLVDPIGVSGHGRLIEPPSRASMWRYGFNTTPNYNDHELYCGGFARQWQKNKGKCGICGDPYDTPEPRANEAGGTYGQGILVRNYESGSKVVVKVELTANHKGYFEFRLCPNNNPKVDPSQDCLDKYVLKKIRRPGDNDDDHPTRTYPGPGNGVIEMRYILPAGLTCTQCVFQWRYIAGNNWGACPNGTQGVGCGPQEEFRGCADVSIVDATGRAEDTPWPTTKPTDIDDETKTVDVGTGEYSGSRFVPFLVGGLFAAMVVVAALYVYFYHLSDIVKKSLLQRKMHNAQPPSGVTCEKMPPAAEPVAPPRTRRSSQPPVKNTEQYISEKEKNNGVKFIY